MRKLLIILALSTSLHATTWFATSSSVNINTANLWVPTSTGNCTGSGTPLVFGAQANGDVFDANGCTALAVNVDPGGVSVEVTLQTNATRGGGFTYATASNLTLHCNITAGNSLAVNVTGSTGGLTVDGNLQGGNSGTAIGLYDNHSTITVVVNGNSTGGTAATTPGWQINSGPATLNGNAFAAPSAASNNADGIELTAATASVMINGNCVGTDQASSLSYGCEHKGGTGVITVTGNLIYGKTGQAIGNNSAGAGIIAYTPASNSNYILMPKDSSYTLGTINSHATQLFPAGAGSGGPYGYVR